MTLSCWGLLLLRRTPHSLSFLREVGAPCSGGPSRNSGMPSPLTNQRLSFPAHGAQASRGLTPERHRGSTCRGAGGPEPHRARPGGQLLAPRDGQVSPGAPGWLSELRRDPNLLAGGKGRQQGAFNLRPLTDSTAILSGQACPVERRPPCSRHCSHAMLTASAGPRHQHPGRPDRAARCPCRLETEPGSPGGWQVDRGRRCGATPGQACGQCRPLALVGGTPGASPRRRSHGSQTPGPGHCTGATVPHLHLLPVPGKLWNPGDRSQEQSGHAPLGTQLTPGQHLPALSCPHHRHRCNGGRAAPHRLSPDPTTRSRRARRPTAWPSRHSPARVTRPGLRTHQTGTQSASAAGPGCRQHGAG